MLNDATHYAIALVAGLAIAVMPRPLIAQRPQTPSANDDSLRVEAVRYFRDSVRSSIALEREPAGPNAADTQAPVATTLGLPRFDRARMLQCATGCPGAPVYLMRVSTPKWSGDTARVSIAWLWRQQSRASGRAVIAEGGDEYLLLRPNGAWKVIGIGRRYRVSRSDRSPHR